MKVVTCFIPGSLRDETLDALVKHAENLQLIVIDPDDQYAYGKAIAKQWRLGESFMVVEPDNVIREDVMDAADNCGCEYGCFPYEWVTNIGPALGCTWFKDTFIAKYPAAVEMAGPRIVSWRQFDVMLMRRVLAAKYHEQPHVHLPPVEHLNEAKKLRPDADPTPLMEVPLW